MPRPSLLVADPTEQARQPAPVTDYVWSVLLVALATGLGMLGRALLSSEDVVMLFMLAIMVVAVRFGRRPSVAAAAISVGAYDFFFVPPLFTFQVAARVTS